MEQDQGNPNKEPNQPSNNNEAQGQVFGSSEEFFGQLESEVNGAIDDSMIDGNDAPTMNKPGNESPVTPGPQVATPGVQQDNSSSIDWEKRYKSSSSEAQKLNQQLKATKAFEPLLNVMRTDKGLVTHIKDYLENKGGVKGVKEKLGLDEDFQYDPNEAMDDPKSDSAKLFNAQVNQAVSKKVGEVQQQNATTAKNNQARASAVKQAREFQAKHKLDSEGLRIVLKEATAKKLSLDDAYYLMNRDNAGQQIASNTRKDVMQQMQNARSIPQSVSHSNSSQVDSSPNDDIFDVLKGSDEADNLFG